MGLLRVEAACRASNARFRQTYPWWMQGIYFIKGKPQKFVTHIFIFEPHFSNNLSSYTSKITKT